MEKVDLLLSKINFICMNMAKFIILCLLSCFLSGCVKESEKYIKLINKSDRNVVFQADNDNYFSEHEVAYICRGLNFTIWKDSTYYYESVDYSGWKADFNLSPYMTFLFMDEEALDKYFSEPCDTIRKYVPIIYQCRVSYEDMERSNWTIVYPPEE